jgi:hypothetical protein
MFSRPSSKNNRSRTTDNSNSNNSNNHNQIDSHRKAPLSKTHDLFDTTTSIDMQTLTRGSLDLEHGARDSPHLPPATYPPRFDSNTHESGERIERVRWNSNSTLGAHAGQDRTLEEATRWQSNSTYGEGQPLRQGSTPRPWPMSPDSEVSGVVWKPQSVRSAV